MNNHHPQNRNKSTKHCLKEWKKIKTNGKLSEITFSCIERLNIDRMALLELIYRININFLRISDYIFVAIDKVIIRFIREITQIKIAKIVLKRKNKVEDTSNFKMCWKAIVIEKMWHWYRDRHINQWKRMKSVSLNIYTSLIFQQGW